MVLLSMKRLYDLRERKMEELWVNLVTMGHVWFIAMEKGMRVRWVFTGEEGVGPKWKGTEALALVVVRQNGRVVAGKEVAEYVVVRGKGTMSKMHQLDKRYNMHRTTCQLHISYTKKMHQMYDKRNAQEDPPIASCRKGWVSLCHYSPSENLQTKKCNWGVISKKDVREWSGRSPQKSIWIPSIVGIGPPGALPRWLGPLCHRPRLGEGHIEMHFQ